MKQFLLGVFTLAVLSASAQSGASSRSPIKLTKGQSITMVTTTESNMDMGMEMKQASTSTMKIDVMDVTEKGYRISKTMTKLKMSSEFMGQEMKYDSENPKESDEKIAAEMNDRIGKSDFGTLDMMTGAYTPDKKDEEESGNPLEGLMGGNEEYELGAVFFLSPDKKTGDSWTTDKSAGEGIKTTVTYTLNSNNGKEAAIGFKSTMEMKKETEAQGMAMTIEMKGTSTGSFVMDPNTGLVKSSSSEDETEGTIEVMGQSTPVSGKTTSKTTYSY